MQSRRTERHAAGRTLGKASRPCTCARHHAHGSSAEPLSCCLQQLRSKEDVALYLHTYGELPSNFISKTKASEAGWNPQEGNLDKVCPGKSIGGSVFYNDDGALPDAPGRTWHECDINYQGGHRGPERIVYSNDGLVYYTPDHYQTFEQLY